MRANRLHDTTLFLPAFQQGEERGFNFFFRKYNQALFYFAQRYTQNTEATEDIVVISFMHAWKKRDQIESEKHLRNYLYKSVYHECLRWLEKEKCKQKHFKIYAAVAEKQEEGYSETLIKTETLRLLKEAMDKLPAQCKKIFYKLYIEGKTVAETAADLQLSTSTIKTQKMRGIKALKLKVSSFCFLAVSLLCYLYKF